MIWHNVTLQSALLCPYIGSTLHPELRPSYAAICFIDVIILHNTYVCVYVCIYIYIYTRMCTYIYIYIYIEREREILSCRSMEVWPKHALVP